MKKATSCLEKATNEGVNHGFDIFRRHIASKLEAIPNPHLQSWAKLQVQQIIFTAQNAGTSYIKNLPLLAPIGTKTVIQYMNITMKQVCILSHLDTLDALNSILTLTNVLGHNFTTCASVNAIGNTISCVFRYS